MSNGIKMPRFPSSFISGPSPRSIYLGRGEELIFDADIRGRKFTWTWIRRKWSDKNGERREGSSLFVERPERRHEWTLVNAPYEYIARGFAPRIYRHPLRSSTLAPSSALGIVSFFFWFLEKMKKGYEFYLFVLNINHILNALKRK